MAESIVWKLLNGVDLKKTVKEHECITKPTHNEENYESHKKVLAEHICWKGTTKWESYSEELDDGIAAKEIIILRRPGRWGYQFEKLTKCDILDDLDKEDEYGGDITKHN